MRTNCAFASYSGGSGAGRIIKRGLILIVVNLALMLGGRAVLNALGYGDSPIRFLWFLFVGGLTGALYARSGNRARAKGRR